ncbi:hypothetical protein DFS34DRAFT_148136 [Phlyctochytrium arcticum]|nr:hypothetical protein DFS34DRAFT_148136 [Phlyctochytrium arcticum]
MEASMGQSKRKNEGLEQHLQDTKIKLQKMEKEFIGSTGALSQLESMYFTALDNIRTLEGEQTARNRLMADLKEQLGNMEKEKGYLERTMSESIKSEKASSARVKELEEELYGAHNGHNKLVDSSLELERMMQMTASKNKELTGMLNVLMKYPDASLGHEITLQDLTSDDEVDTILKEMINSNNLRISLLEQKNNEFRVLRLGQSSRQKGPNLKRQASKDVLYDTESVQRISNSLTLKHLEDQAAMRGSASALSAAPSASKAALRFRSENSYSTSDSRAGSPQQRIPETDSQRAPPRVTTEAWAESGTSNGVGHRHIHPPAPSITRYPPSELVDAYFAERPHTKKPLQQTQFTIPGGTQSPKVYSSLKQHPSSRPGKKLSWNLSSRS